MSSTPTTGPIVSGYQHNKCVDDQSDATTRDNPVVISDCNGSDEQNWTVEDDGTIQINGDCLDIYRAEKVSRAKVQLFPCNGGLNQQWEAVGNTLVNPHSSKCLDLPRYNTTDGTQLEIFTCNGGRNQSWELP